MQPIVILKRVRNTLLPYLRGIERLASGSGVKIVLTASATEMSDFLIIPLLLLSQVSAKAHFRLDWSEKHSILRWNASLMAEQDLHLMA